MLSIVMSLFLMVSPASTTVFANEAETIGDEAIEEVAKEIAEATETEAEGENDETVGEVIEGLVQEPAETESSIEEDAVVNEGEPQEEGAGLAQGNEEPEATTEVTDTEESRQEEVVDAGETVAIEDGGADEAAEEELSQADVLEQIEQIPEYSDASDPMGENQSRWDEVVEISEGTYNVGIGIGERAKFSFTPSESGWYVFRGYAYELCHVELYDSDHNYLKGKRFSSWNHFSFGASLEAGTTYYYEAYWDISVYSGNMKVTLEKYAPTEITEGTYTVSIGAGGRAEFSFTPSESGWYVFRSNASQYCNAELYDSGYNYLRVDNGRPYFWMVSSLEAGATYYYEAFWDDSAASGNMDVTLEKYSPVEITEGTYTVSIGARERAKFSFTPRESGVYVFRGNAGGWYCRVDLYNSGRNYLKNTSGVPNFRLVASLEAGATYYYEVLLESPTASGDMDFTLEKYSPVEITEGTYTDNTGEGKVAEFSFTPSESGVYVFRSNADQYSFAYMYDSGYNYQHYAYGEPNNFWLVASLEAGATYYYEVYGSDMEVTLEKYAPTEITEGTYTVSIGAGERAEFSFTPVESGLYVFRNNAGQNSCAKLYNSSYYYQQHVYGEPNNFRLAASLEAGATYYYEVFWDDPTASGDMQVTLERDGQPIPHAPLEIVAQPESVKAYMGEKAVVTVEASGEDLTCQWYLKNQTASKFSKSSVTKNTYCVTMSDAVDGRQLYCVITDIHGDSVTTDTVTLSQIEKLTIAAQPVDVTVANGEKAAVAVEATGEGLGYQWYLKNKTASKFTKSSVTKSTYSVTMSDAVDGRQLYCIITDKNGNTLATDIVTLHKYVFEIVVQPQDVVVANGEKAVVAVEARGEGLSYQWYLKNKTATKFTKSSVTKNTYSVTMTDAVDGRQVYCVVTDKRGNMVVSEIATLNQAQTLSIATQPQDCYVLNGEKATTTVAATGSGLSYQWYLKNKTATKFTKSSVTKSTYSVTMSDTVDGRQVYCIVTDKNGDMVVSDTITLSKYVPISIVSLPQSATVANGKKAVASVKATGSGLKYQWYVKNKTAVSFTKSSITKDTYSVTMSDAVDGRQLYCVITDAKGCSLKTNTVVFAKK